MADKRHWATRDRNADITALSNPEVSARIAHLRAIKQSVAKASERLAKKARIRFAASFAIDSLEEYWNEIQCDQSRVWPLRPPFEELVLPKLDESSKWLAKKLGRAAALVDPMTAGYFVGTTYAAAIPKELRSQLGVYYTPPAIAARLLDQAAAAGIDWGSCSVLDPACGGGAFLAPVAERIIKELSHSEPGPLLDALAARIRGFEIDPIAAWMSQVLLDAMVLPLCRAVGRGFPVVVEVRNTLAHASAWQSFDLVIGNPPYGRITLSPRVRERYAESLYGHANLYGVFTDVALRWVKPGGVVAYVTPTSFLAGEYFKNLRRLIGRTAPPLTIDFIADRKGVFDEVLQETVLATYRRLALGTAPRDRSAAVTSITPIDETVVRISDVGSFILPDDPRSPWLVPRNSNQHVLITRLHTMPDRLVDWGYEVSTGPLVWNRHKNQLREHEGRGCLPLIWAESVRQDGTFRLRATKINHRQFFKPRPGDDWVVIKKSCVLVQRTTAKEQSRRLIAAVLPISVVRKHGGAVVENHLNMLRPIASSPAISPQTLAAFLNSGVADRVFRCLSGSVAVSAYELEALPLPPTSRLQELEGAVRGEAPREVVDRICARLYGLDSDA
jgi:adenine-specific DNA-methyltransferase